MSIWPMARARAWLLRHAADRLDAGLAGPTGETVALWSLSNEVIDTETTFRSFLEDVLAFSEDTVDRALNDVYAIPCFDVDDAPTLVDSPTIVSAR